MNKTICSLVPLMCMLAMPNLVDAQNKDPLQQAEICLQQGLYSQAISLLNNYKLKVRQDYADYLKALACFKNRNNREAIDILLEFEKKWPGSAYLHQSAFLLADAYLQAKDYKAAEAIYAGQAKRLLSEDRKKEIAAIYRKLAESLAYRPKPEEMDLPPPDYTAAYRFYSETLKLEIGRELRDEVMFKMACMQEAARDYARAATEYTHYLEEFDPDWAKNLPVSARQANREYKGKFIYQARLKLAEALLAGQRLLEARRVLEDTLALLRQGSGPAGAAQNDLSRLLTGLTADARNMYKSVLRRLPYTYRLPQPLSDFELEGGVKVLDEFLAAFPDDVLACSLAWYKAQALMYRGRTERAISALKDIIEKKTFTIPEQETPADKSTREELGILLSPEEQFDTYQKEALAKLGELYFSQKKYGLAVKTYADYIARFPNGPHWAQAQQGMIDAEYQTGIDKLNEQKYDDAEAIWNNFLNSHPLDARSRKILFTLAQIRYQEGLTLKSRDKKQAGSSFEKALVAFKRLITKYPATEESSLAQLRVGEIQERELGDFEAALKTYKALTWGSSAREAGERVSRMVNKELLVRTERTCRTDEPAVLKIQVRNIEKLRVNAYKLDLEAYFRKYHGIEGVENLDLSLITPDTTWEVEIKGYKPYLPLEQELEVPMQGPGVYAVNISSAELEATTLLIRSDIDFILKSSRSEVLVFVEDRRRHKPAGGARVLLTDGNKVILEGKTGTDGILHKKLDGLAALDTLHAFVESQASVAATGLDISELGFSSGLLPKGYIYTDRPAYKPGETVQLKGILREVHEGSYRAATGMWALSVADAGGRTIHQEDVTLSAYGTFNSAFTLPVRAGQGNYTISAMAPDKGRYFNGSFVVEEFKLEKIRLSIAFDRNQYFRGEMVKAEIKAEYYFGQPVAGHELTYRTPDGLTFQGQTDAQGKFAFEFDTTPFNPGQALLFSADLTAENVHASRQVVLVAREFTLTVSTRKAVSLAGLPVEVSVTAVSAGTEERNETVAVSLLRRVTRETDPLIEQIPWLKTDYFSSLTTYAEVEVEKQTVKLQAGGTGRLTFKPATGGTYLIRAVGQDRQGNIITGETAIFISDDSDKTLLRFFANKENYSVGDTDTLLLHSRLKQPALALLTFEGEGIISYSVLPLHKAENPVPLVIKHEHFPNFSVSVAAMAGSILHEATTAFTVERKLQVEIKPARDVFTPAESGAVEVIITDHQGQPVSAEFSLALVNEAIFDLYKDPLPDIITFFQAGLQRETRMASMTSCTFSYTPETRTISQDILAEAERMEPYLDREDDLVSKEEAAYEGKALSRSKKSEINAPLPQTTKSAYDEASGPRGSLSEPQEAEQARKELPTEGYWLARVMTDHNGRAQLTIPLPAAAGSYRLHVKGCTGETLVGESSQSLVIRKEFFVTLKTPALLQENDEVRFIGRIHNLGDYHGPVQAVLKIESNGITEELPAVTAAILPRSTQEIVFPSCSVPPVDGLELTCAVKTDKGTEDQVEVSLPVRPWGLPFQVRKAGTAQETTTLFIGLDEARKYSGRRMHITLSSGLADALVNLVLGEQSGKPYLPYETYTPFTPGPESELLALSSVMRYLKNRETPPGTYQQLVKKLQSALSALVAEQSSDGSWNWAQVEQISVTSQAYWALQQALRLGFRVDEQVAGKAKTYLKNAFSGLPQDDNEAKAQILHALSLSRDADYTFVNRLYRNRNELSEAALAFLALALIELDKKDIARELLALLEQKAVDFTLDKDGGLSGGLPLKARKWQGFSNQSWLRNSLETTALVLLVYMQLKPQDPGIGWGWEYLMSEFTYSGVAPAKAIGYLALALGEYYGRVQTVKNDFTVKVSVNDTPAGEYVFKTQAAGHKQNLSLPVPAAALKAGHNRIQFQYSGQGEYFYTVELTGFSTDFTDPQSWDRPSFKAKKWIHEPLRYKGKNIAASTTEITQLEMNQTLEVQIDFHYSSHTNYLVLEEHLPSGVTLLKETVTGNYSYLDYQPNKLLFYIQPGKTLSSLRYQLAAYTPGKYRVLPPVLREVFQPHRVRLGRELALTLLGPGEKSTDPYRLNENELFGLGSACFNDGDYRQALTYLEELYKANPRDRQPDLARMLLWIRTDTAYFNASQIVEYFEVLKEKYPDLFIPFDKILAVGKAYEEINELERAYLVYRAIIEASFIKDSAVGGNLENAGEYLGSIDYMLKLSSDYPAGGAVTSSLFALAQTVYSYAAQADTISRRIKLKEEDKKPVTRESLLDQADAMLWNFMSRHPDHELVDDAAFTVLNIQLDKKNYAQAVSLSRDYQKRYAGSPFLSNYQYMEALAYFSQRKYQEAIQAARTVAEGKSENKNLATYILGQIYHAQRKPPEALKYYESIKNDFTDAQEAIRYFTRQSIKLEEVHIFSPGEKVHFDLRYRNIKELNLQVYKVDLMKLYLREKNLSKITEINLAGITPTSSQSLKLGDGKDYTDKNYKINLALKEEGAYLVVCRGDDLFTSSLVLITPLTMETQEDPVSGRVRVNIFDKVRNLYPDTVHVKVIGSDNTQFISGDTDLRGIFVADGVHGTATVIARDKLNRYAFYRGDTWLGAEAANFSETREEYPALPKDDFDAKYRGNLFRQQEMLQEQNKANLRSLYDRNVDGVQINQAY